MSQKKLVVMVLAVVALAAAPLSSFAQAPQGQQPPADGQRRGGGRGRGDGQGGAQQGGQAAPRGGGAPQAQAQMIKQIKPGLYMVTGAGGNSTVRVSDQGVILVDTKNLGDQFYNDLVAQIKTVTPQPVKYVVVGSEHGDHTGGIGAFPPGVTYFALSLQNEHWRQILEERALGIFFAPPFDAVLKTVELLAVPRPG